MVKTETIFVKSEGNGDIIDITAKVQKTVSDSGKKEGSAVIFINGSTASVSTIEYEPNLVRDVRKVFEKIAPYGQDYEHHKTWGDDNGASHVRATLTGPGITVPFKDGNLLLGTWQQIAVLDFDTRPRNREVVIQVIG
ncbi:MAG: YjbQ family protein [Candidatus Aenigmarchaeota archaeon]|nr:YjbQ family protein [Candidatus Aenigmarchaeota archaeon]